MTSSDSGGVWAVVSLGGANTTTPGFSVRLASQCPRCRMMSSSDSGGVRADPEPADRWGSILATPGTANARTAAARSQRADRRTRDHSPAAAATTNASNAPSRTPHQLSWRQANPSATSTGPNATAIEARDRGPAEGRSMSQTAGTAVTSGRRVAQTVSVDPSRRIRAHRLAATGLPGRLLSLAHGRSRTRNPGSPVLHMTTGTAATPAAQRATERTSPGVRAGLAPRIHDSALASSSPPQIHANPYSGWTDSSRRDPMWPGNYSARDRK